MLSPSSDVEEKEPNESVVSESALPETESPSEVSKQEPSSLESPSTADSLEPLPNSSIPSVSPKSLSMDLTENSANMNEICPTDQLPPSDVTPSQQPVDPQQPLAIPPQQPTSPQQSAIPQQQQPAIPQQQPVPPQQQSAIPQQQSAIPQQQSAIPQQQSAIPQQQSAIPQQQSAIPQQQSAIPQQQSAIPQQQPVPPQQQPVPPQQQPPAIPSFVPSISPPVFPEPNSNLGPSNALVTTTPSSQNSSSYSYPSTLQASYPYPPQTPPFYPYSSFINLIPSTPCNLGFRLSTGSSFNLSIEANNDNTVSLFIPELGINMSMQILNHHDSLIGLSLPSVPMATPVDLPLFSRPPSMTYNPSMDYSPYSSSFTPYTPSPLNQMTVNPQPPASSKDSFESPSPLSSLNYNNLDISSVDPCIREFIHQHQLEAIYPFVLKYV